MKILEKEIRELIDFLNYHTKLYDEGTPIISDKEWDDKYFKLLHLEEASNIRYSDSPTQRIVYSSVSRLEKVKHNHDYRHSKIHIPSHLSSETACEGCAHKPQCLLQPPHSLWRAQWRWGQIIGV